MLFSNFTLQCPVCPHITLITAFKLLGSINLPLTPKTPTAWLYGVSTANTIFRAYLILEKYQRFLTLLHTLSVFYITIPRKEMFLFWWVFCGVGGGYVRFYYSTRKKLTRFFACVLNILVILVILGILTPEKSACRADKKFLLRLDTPSSATWYPLLCDLIPPPLRLDTPFFP